MPLLWITKNMRRSLSGLWLKHCQNKKKQITVFKKWACSPYFSEPQWRRCKGLTHVQTSKIPGWPNSLQKSLTQNVLQNVDQSNFTWATNNSKCSQIVKPWNTEVFWLLSSFSSPFSFLLVSQGLLPSTHLHLCDQPLLRGILLLFLGPEDLRPSNHSLSLNETMLPSSLMAGTFHLHSSDNFDAYLSEVCQSHIYNK